MTLQNDGFPLPDIVWLEQFEMATSFSRVELIEQLSQHHIKGRSPFFADVHENQNQFTIKTRTPYLRGKLKAVVLDDQGSHLTIAGIVGVESHSISLLVATSVIVTPLVFTSNIITGFVFVGVFVGVILFGWWLYAAKLKQQLLAVINSMCKSPEDH